jgi:hypothetical protein
LAGVDMTGASTQQRRETQMSDTFKIGDAVRIISRQRTGTIDRISDGIAIIRPDDNISHFTAAFITDLEPKP